MERSIILAFVLGSLITASVFSMSTISNEITGSAIYDADIIEEVNASIEEINVTDYSLINEAFQNNLITTYGADCKPNAYIINKTVVKYECRFFYKDSVSIRKVSNTGSMWPNLLGGGYVIVSSVRNISDLAAGDIIIVSDLTGREVAHRIIEAGKDEYGSYVITKGDNNNIDDGVKFRNSDIKAKVVGVLY